MYEHISEYSEQPEPSTETRIHIRVKFVFRRESHSIKLRRIYFLLFHSCSHGDIFPTSQHHNRVRAMSNDIRSSSRTRESEDSSS